MWNLLGTRRTSRRPIWGHIVAHQRESILRLYRSCCERYRDLARPPRPCDWRSRLYWWPLSYIVDPHCNQKIETTTRYINPFFFISISFISLNAVSLFKKLYCPSNLGSYTSSCSTFIFILNYSLSPVFTLSLFCFKFYIQPASKIVTFQKNTRELFSWIIFYFVSLSLFFTLCISPRSISQGIERSFAIIARPRRRDLGRTYKSLSQFVEFFNVPEACPELNT